MWKNISIGLGVLCAALASANIYLQHQVEVARDSAAAEKEARLDVEARGRGSRANSQFGASDFSSGRREQRYEAPSETARVAANYSSGFDNASAAPGRFEKGPRGMGMGGMGPGGMPGGPGMTRDLIKALKLSDSDAKKLQQIFADRQNKMRQMADENRGNPFDPETMETLQQQTNEQVHALLGEEKSQAYDDYQKYMQEHGRINQLNTRLEEAGGTTLSQDQQDKLFATMKLERSAIPAPLASDYTNRADYTTAMNNWRTDYDQRVQTKAQTILTPDQLTLFKNLRQFRPPRGQ